jgi:hypothetical protein
MYEVRVPVIFTGKIEDVEKFLSRNQDPVMIRERKIDEIPTAPGTKVEVLKKHFS